MLAPVRRALPFVAAALVTAVAPAQQAAFAPARIFGDHMVLPRGARAPLFGQGPPGATVRAWGSFGGPTATTRVDANGRWLLELSTPTQPGPHRVLLTCGAETFVFDDVLLGDVWLASGQSNMEMPVGNVGGWRSGVRDWQQEVAAADHPQLRLFTVRQRIALGPVTELDGQWQVCSPATVANWSASGYFFGRELLRHGKGPIGLVVSAWGGTVCEAWTGPNALAAFAEFAPALARQQDYLRSGGADGQDAMTKAFWDAVAARDPVPASDTPDVELPDRWSRTGLADFDGVACYRRTVTLPVAFRGRALWLELGQIDDCDTAFVNGQRVGGIERHGAWQTPRRYLVPATTVALRSDDVELMVRVLDTGGEGGIVGPAAALRLYPDGEPAAAISLAGVWQRQRGAAMAELPPFPHPLDTNPNAPGVLWHGMIEPLVPFPFAGVIWYQGESNVGRAAQYARLFPAMIADWRTAFGRDLPFFFVQIAPWSYANDRGQAADLRLAQAAALALPNTGMVVTMDIGDPADIHPLDKQSVGRRLALQALAKVYGDAVVADGPRATAVTAAGGALRVRFTGVEGGLVADGPILGFEVAGIDRNFVTATARIDGDSVLVRSDAVPSPVHVRCGQAAAGALNLRNGHGLPVWPFRLQVQSD